MPLRDSETLFSCHVLVLPGITAIVYIVLLGWGRWSFVLLLVCDKDGQLLCHAYNNFALLYLVFGAVTQRFREVAYPCSKTTHKLMPQQASVCGAVHYAQKFTCSSTRGGVSNANTVESATELLKTTAEAISINGCQEIGGSGTVCVADPEITTAVQRVVQVRISKHWNLLITTYSQVSY